MSLIQLLKFKTWEMRIFKMPCLETPRFQTIHWVTVASGHWVTVAETFFRLEMKAKKPTTQWKLILWFCLVLECNGYKRLVPNSFLVHSCENKDWLGLMRLLSVQHNVLRVLLGPLNHCSALFSFDKSGLPLLAVVKKCIAEHYWVLSSIEGL